MDTRYCVEYAKSNRSTCKGCKLKIDKDILRIGTTVSGLGDYVGLHACVSIPRLRHCPAQTLQALLPQDAQRSRDRSLCRQDMTSWRHLECTKKPSKLTEPSQIDGVGMLKPEDEARVYEWWTNPAAYAQKRKAENNAAAVGAAQAADDEPPSTPKKAKTTAAPSDTPDSNKALPPACPTPPTTSSAIHDEAAKRAEYEAAFGALPVPELKNCLRENQQLLSGAKGELVERCVDRKLYGNLPRCTRCGIGRLKVTYIKSIGHGGQGIFSCPGGYDDDQYVRCGYRSTCETRPPWTVTQHEAYTKPQRKSGGGGKSGGASTSAIVVD